MPVVQILEGPKDVALKRELIEKITAAFVDTYDMPASAVQVWIHDVPTDSWGVGGKLAAD